VAVAAVAAPVAVKKAAAVAGACRLQLGPRCSSVTLVAKTAAKGAATVALDPRVDGTTSNKASLCRVIS